MRRWRNPVALTAAVALISAGCGARVAPYLGAAQVQPGSAGGGQALSGSTATTVPVARSSGATTSGRGSTGGGSSTRTYTVGGSAGSGGGGTSSGGSSSGGSGGSAGTKPVAVQTLDPSNFDFSPAAQAQYCTGASGNTASATGISPTTVTVGNVSGLTGLISNSFTQGVQAVEAAFKSVDRFGGVCGRQLQVISEDDQQSSSTDASDVEYLIPKVFAFVGDLSDADNGGVQPMESAGVPDMGPAINVNRSNAPVYWSATGGSVTVRGNQAYINDGWFNGLKQYHDMPSSIAVLSYDIPISAQAGEEYAALFQKEGINLCYTNYSIPPAPGTVMQSVVQSMQNDHCGGVFTTMDDVGNADMLQDMQNNGFTPQLVSTTYEGYSPAQIQLAGGSASAEKLQVAISSLPLSSGNSAIQLYEQELATYEPGQAPTEFGLEAWADAEMFIYALLKAGRNPTRSSFVSTLSGISNWTTGGAFGAYTPSERTGPPCVDTVEVQGNNFATLWPPGGGLYCNGQLVDVGSAS